MNNFLYIPTIASYLGAKTQLALTLAEIIGSTKTKIYGELFGGMGSTLLNKARHPVEIYNDFGFQNYAIFHCLADPDWSQDFINEIIQSEYSEEQFEQVINGDVFQTMSGYEKDIREHEKKIARIDKKINPQKRKGKDTKPIPPEILLELQEKMDALETELTTLKNEFPKWKNEHVFEIGVDSLILTKLSRLGLIRRPQFAGYAGDGLEADRYENWKLNLYDYAERLKGVITKNQNATNILAKHKTNNNAVFLCDPPYTGELRLSKDDYVADDFNHDKFLRTIVDADAKIIVCGYENDLYDLYLNDDTGWSKKMIGEQPKTSKNNGMGEMRDIAQEWIWINF